MIYQELIDSILKTRGRFGCGNKYHERHHIMPKCCGGNDDESNLIDLYPSEHFVAHKLLSEENPENEKLVYAFAIMAFCDNAGKRYVLTPEEYAEARTTFSEMLKNKYKDKRNHPSYGKHISDERKRLISNINKGNKYCVGRAMSDETRKKISKANRNPSDETRRKMSRSQKGNFAGDKNPRARPVIRLADGKIYGCGKYAAEENGIRYTTFKSRMQKHTGGFMYYDEWLLLKN